MSVSVLISMFYPMAISLQCHSFLAPALSQWVTMWPDTPVGENKDLFNGPGCTRPPWHGACRGLGWVRNWLGLCWLVELAPSNRLPPIQIQAGKGGGWVEASWSKDKLSPLVDDTVPAGQSSTHIPTNVLSLSAGPKDKQPPSYCIFFFPISDPSTSSHTIDLHFSNNTFLLPVNYKCLGLCKVCWLKMPNTQYTSMFTTQYQLCLTKCRIHPPKYQTLFNNVFCCFLQIYEINIILVMSRPLNTNKLAKNLKLCSEKMWVQFTPPQQKVGHRNFWSKVTSL